jgi:hypothetical protein
MSNWLDFNPNFTFPAHNFWTRPKSPARLGLTRGAAGGKTLPGKALKHTLTTPSGDEIA